MACCCRGWSSCPTIASSTCWACATSSPTWTPPGRPGLQVVDFGDLRLHVRPRRRAALAAACSMPAWPTIRRRWRSWPGRSSIRIDRSSSAPTARRPCSRRRAPGARRAVQCSAHRWQARVSLTEPGYLLQREAWYPGWRARVDGVEVPVLRANLLYRAVPLERGRAQRRVLLRVRPASRVAWW